MTSDQAKKGGSKLAHNWTIEGNFPSKGSSIVRHESFISVVSMYILTYCSILLLELVSHHLTNVLLEPAKVILIQFDVNEQQ